MVDGTFHPARLHLISAGGNIFLFHLSARATPMIYVRPALLTALRSGLMHPAEHAPVFERAVEALLAGADALAPTGKRAW